MPKLLEELLTTPGEWLAIRDESHFDTLSTITCGAEKSLLGLDHRMIVQVGGWAGWEEQEANTRMMSEAKNLYRDLSDVLKLVDLEKLTEEPHYAHNWETVTRAVATLERAGGK